MRYQPVVVVMQFIKRLDNQKAILNKVADAKKVLIGVLDIY
jgi:hypothetical protein